MPSINPIFNNLPPRIRSRFTGIPSYAKALIAADEARLPKRRRTSAFQMRQVQALVQLLLLDRFLQQGTRVAQDAVRELESIGVPGFSVGATTFQGQNEAVMRGENLSIRLRKAVPQVALLADKFSALSVSQLVLAVRNLVRNA